MSRPSKLTRDRTLELHMQRTGERSPNGGSTSNYKAPVNLNLHGGYAVVKRRNDPLLLDGPFAWWENAVRAASRLNGIVVRRVDVGGGPPRQGDNG